MKKRTAVSVAAAIMASLALAAAMHSCNKDDTPDAAGTGDVGDTTAVTSAPAYEEYVPVVDADADSVDGIAIRSADELAKIGRDGAYPLDGDYVLVIDLDLSDKNWTPIGGAEGRSGEYRGNFVFSGTFDGRGHKINGLHIDAEASSTSYWGLFGSVGSGSKTEPAIIQNIVFTNVDVMLASNTDSAVGALAGQVNGSVVIDSISLLSGSVEYSGSGNLGCGSLIGQCRTQKNGRVTNELIKITNVYSAVDVSSNNSGWDTGAGLIGRIRDSRLGELSGILYTGRAMSEGTTAQGIATGDNTAVTMSDIYCIGGRGKVRDGMGKAVTESDLCAGTLTMPSGWNVQAGMYPILQSVLDSKSFSILDLAKVSFADGDSKDKIREDFTLPTKAAGASVEWTSGDESIINIDENGKAKVTRPESGAADVVVTATWAAGEGKMLLHVLQKSAQSGQIYFITEYIEPGKPVEVGGVTDGVELVWTIENYATGKTRTETTSSPSLTLTEADEESLVTVSCDGCKDIEMYYSSLPIIYMTSKTRYRAVGREYTETEMKLCASGEYADMLYDGKAEIRLRGNSTAGFEKRPFKVKLDKKSNLLGIDDEGASKHWCLLANAVDLTLMRNKLLMDFSGAIGMDTHINSENVVLMYNGEYYGVYELTEHVRVGGTRVDVFDWEEYAGDAASAIADKLVSDGKIKNAEAKKTADTIENSMLTDWSWMKNGKVTYKGVSYTFTDLGLDPLPPETGGFLLEMDFYAQSNWGLANVQTAYAQPLYFNTPEPVGENSLWSFNETALYSYAARYVQAFEYAVHSDDFFFDNDDSHYYAEEWWNKWANRTYTEIDYRDDEFDGMHYSDLFDMDDLVQNFIFCEIAMNWDSMKNSMFVYKDVDGKAYIGPQWDFDWAWGNVLWNPNTWRPESWHCRDQSFMVEQYYQEVQWNCLLIRDPYFLMKVWESWQEMRGDEIEDLVGHNGNIPKYAKQIRRAALANDARWGGRIPFWNNIPGVNFDTEVDRMTEFVDTRMTWLDKQMKSMDTFIDSLGVYHPSNLVSVTSSTAGGKTTFTAEVTAPGAEYVTFQINGKTMIETEFKGGKASVTVDNGTLDADGLNCVVAYAVNAQHEYIIDDARSDHGNYDQPINNYHVFEIK